MVIQEGYNPLLVQEVMSYFFGVGKSDVAPATKDEIATFLDLLESPVGEILALDYLNVWLIDRGMSKIPDTLLNSVKKFDKIKKRDKKSRRKTIKENT